jgi:aspartate/methionine/tyrosine aminotransferase
MRHYGRVPYDLATSGVPALLQSELGAVPSLDDPDGWEQFRAAIAQHHGLPETEVVPALGASHGLWLGYTAMVEPGDDVVVEAPAYEPLVVAAEAAGARVVRFERTASDGYAVDPERVAAALTPKTRVVAITNLHNPSGARVSDDAIRAVARLLEPRRAFLFVDEVYAPFDDLGRADSGRFLKSARRLAPNVVATASLTKAYGLGPQRIGWVLAPASIVERAEDAIIASNGNLPVTWMHRGVLALSHVGALAERTRGLLGTKRAQVAAWMRARPALRWSAPPAGLFGFAEIPSRPTLDLLPIIEEGITRDGVLVAPGSFFGKPNGFRLAWSIASERLVEGLSRLDGVLQRAGLYD